MLMRMRNRPERLSVSVCRGRAIGVLVFVMFFASSLTLLCRARLCDASLEATAALALYKASVAINPFDLYAPEGLRVSARVTTA